MAAAPEGDNFTSLHEVSIVAVSFSCLCGILIIIFSYLISAAICPFCIVRCLSPKQHRNLSLKIHRRSHSCMVSRHQLTLFDPNPQSNPSRGLQLSSVSGSHIYRGTMDSIHHSSKRTDPVELTPITDCVASSNTMATQHPLPISGVSGAVSMSSLTRSAGASSMTVTDHRALSMTVTSGTIDEDTQFTVHSDRHSPRSHHEFKFDSKFQSEDHLKTHKNRADGQRTDTQITSISESNGNVIAQNELWSHRCLMWLCIPCCYWDSSILALYKRKKAKEMNDDTASFSLRAQILDHISYFGLAMNLVLLMQCLVIVALYEGDTPNELNGSFVSTPLLLHCYSILHNIWLILCDVALTGIILNVLHIVSSTNEDGNGNSYQQSKVRLLLIANCGIFVICTVVFHILTVALEAVYWDMIGGVIRNVLISILCAVLAQNTRSLKKSVSVAFARVRASISSAQQISEHKQVVHVLVLLFVGSICLSIMVIIAAVQYIVDLVAGGHVTLGIAHQPLPGQHISDILWIFIKIMSSLIILYYASVNMKQRKRMMMSVLNEQLNVMKEKQRSKKRWSTPRNLPSTTSTI